MNYHLIFIVTNCNKHICDSEWEMENKLCLVCSGLYDKILLQAGLKPKNIHYDGR